MTERKRSPRQAVFGSPSARASGNPFIEIREEIAVLREDKLRRETLDHIVDCLRGAERDYAEGNMYDAVLGVWKAALLEIFFTERSGSRRMRAKRKAPTASGKETAEAAWRRAFNTHLPFRLWDASDQADYLTANYSRDVVGIKRESLEKYIRAFCKKAQ